MHTHEALELVYYTSGKGRTVLGKKVHPVRENFFAVIPAGLPHDQQNATDLISICVGISRSQLNEAQGVWRDGGGILEKILTRLVEELKHRRTGFESISQGLLYEAEGWVLRCIQEANVPPQKNDLVRKAIELIQHREGTLSVRDVAQQLYVSKDYLRHLFKEYAGQSPMRFILRARVEKARELLAQGDLRIGEIAEQCGFENIYYFSRFFRKATGETPSEFRRKHS